ncbi:hypothetical protein [Halobacillus yeomjeoni]|uniref:Uncharacterized protein n=1 Tax=Halobacillus yeomjeoni TaxID=311194 RepID=A0A931HT96_9BACI|nr:hypothetical protein [Halobacillus yeomjeoni]MBH0229165.1 hypothetical protein [Halobacillus yeomjeoni]
MTLDEVTENEVLLDARDYQTSHRDQIDQAHCIPFSYLNRHHTDLPDKKVVLVVEDLVEKNLCTRLLRKKGYEVDGYVMPEKEAQLSVACVCHK